jgi:ketosteroid isomerase-like protein
MAIMKRSEAIRSYFGAYASKDRGIIENLLTDDFTFTSPYDDAIDKTTYLRKCWPNCERIRVHELERIVEEADEVFVRYLIHTHDGRQFRNTEMFVFAGDRIRHVDVYFGPTYRDGAFVAQQKEAQ